MNNRVLYFDIETTGLDPKVNKITAIQYLFKDEDKAVVHINADMVKDKFVRDDVLVVYHNNEVDLLAAFKHMTTNNIVAGWNTSGGKYVGEHKRSGGFDINFIVERAKNLSINVNSVISLSGDDYTNANGIHNFEAVDLDIAYNNLIDNSARHNKLKTIAIKENISLKLDVQGNFATWHLDDPQQWFDYAVRDVVILKELDAKLKITDMMIAIAKIMSSKVKQALTKSMIWNNRLNIDYHNSSGLPDEDDGIDTHSPVKYGGGLSIEPAIFSVYEDVAVFDINSLYPSIIQALNLSYETLLEPANVGHLYYAKDKLLTDEEAAKSKSAVVVKYEGTDDEADKILSGAKSNSDDERIVTFSGAVYDGTKRGIMPQSLDTLFAERKRHKEIMKEVPFGKEHDDADVMQKAIKVVMNSLYGIVGQNYFNYARNSIRTTITSTAHVVLTALRKAIEQAGYQAIYGDTDSIFVNCKQDEINTVQAIINDTLAKAKEYYSFKKDLVMEYEKFCNKIIFVSKKNYAYEDDKGVYHNKGGLFGNSKSCNLLNDWYARYGKEYHFYNEQEAIDRIREMVDNRPKLDYVCKKIGRNDGNSKERIIESAEYIKDKFDIEFGEYDKVMVSYFDGEIKGGNEIMIPFDFVERDEIFAEIIDRDMLYANVLKQLKSFIKKVKNV